MSGLKKHLRHVLAIVGLTGIVLAAFCVAPPIVAQGSRKDDIVFNAQGRPMAGAMVRVCTSAATGQPCSPLAQIYSDPGLTQALANPTSTDGLGNYNFYASPGRYEIEISGPSITTKQLPNVILPSDPTSPTFTTVTTTSGISAFSLSLSGNLTVTGSAAVTGALTVGGAPVPSTAAENQWTSSQHFKGQNPWRDVTAQTIAASGSTQSTTLGATFSSGSTTVTLTSALDFKNNQQVRIVGAGSTSALTAPTGTAVTPCTDAQSGAQPTCPGGTGATTYQYQVLAVDSKWGASPTASAVSISNGNASLSFTNYNKVTWGAVTGAIYYCVYGRVSGSMTLQGCTPNLGWYDYGKASGLSSVVTEPSTIPTTPPGSAGIGFYYGTILSGAGTTTLTMDTAAGTTLASGTVEHDDSLAIQTAWNASATGTAKGDKLFLPCGSYNLSQPIIFSPPGVNNPVGMEIYGESEGCVSLSQHAGQDIFLVVNNNADMYFHDFTALGGGNSSKAIIRYAGGVSGNGGQGTARVKVDRIQTSGGGISIRSDNNVILFHGEKITLATDVNLMFGEPGNPIQLDSITCEKCDTYTGTGVVNWPGQFIFVGNGTGTLRFNRGLQEGPTPSGYTGAAWWMGGFTGDVEYDQVEFAPENAVASGAHWQAVPGLTACCNRLIFLNELEGLPDDGGSTFDWSAASNGKGPQTVLWNVITNNPHQIFKNQNDTANGLAVYNSTLVPAVNLFGGGSGTQHLCVNCRGFNNGGVGNYEQILTGIVDSGSLLDPIALNDQSAAPGLFLFHVNPLGTIYGQEHAAPTCAANQDFIWEDNTAHAWRKCENNGATFNVAGTLSGTTGSIGGSALTAGQCASGTVSVSGSTTSMTVSVSPNTYPGDGFIPWGYVSSSGTVTVKVCAELAGTPTASTYNVRVIQ
jgi:hypothetical protein